MADAVEPEAERTVVIERDFAAPVHIVFRAFTTPEHLRAWFGPPGFPLTLCEVNFRVGGRYRFGMTGPGGQALPVFGGEYLAIEQDRLIRYTNRFEQPGSEAMIVTLRFEARGAQTHLTQSTVFASKRMMEAHVGRGYAQGVQASFEQLAALLRPESP